MKAALFVFCSLLLMGCAQQEIISEQAYAPPAMIQSTLTGAVVEYEPIVKDYEVRLKVLNEESDALAGTEEYFFPATYTANVGDTLRLTFLLDHPRFVSVEGYFAENVHQGVVEFTPKEAGKYSMVCWDCEGNPTADIVVS